MSTGNTTINACYYIPGSTLDVTGNTTITGATTLSVTLATTLSSTLDVTGATNITGATLM